MLNQWKEGENTRLLQNIVSLYFHELFTGLAKNFLGIKCIVSRGKQSPKMHESMPLVDTH